MSTKWQKANYAKSKKKGKHKKYFVNYTQVKKDPSDKQTKQFYVLF